MPGGLGTYTNLSSPSGSTQLNASPTHAQNHTTLTTFVTDIVAQNTRREKYNVVYAADYGMLTTAHAQTNGNALRAAVAAAYAASPGGYEVVCPQGTYEMDTVTGASLGVESGATRVCVGIHSNSKLTIPPGCELKLMGQSTSLGVIGTVYANTQFIANIGTQNITIGGGGTVNGNAQAIATANTWSGQNNYMEGVVLWNCTNSVVENLTVKNWYSTYGRVDRDFTGSYSSGSTTLTGTGFTASEVGSLVTDRDGGSGIVSGTRVVSITNSTTAVMSAAATGNGTGGMRVGHGIESFQVNIKRCTFTQVRGVRLLNEATDYGIVACGLHMDHGSHNLVSHSSWDKMDIQGISAYMQRHLTLSNLWATRNLRGFNFEYCWNVHGSNMVAGGYVVRDTESASNDNPNSYYTDGQNLANTSLGRPSGKIGTGFHFLIGDEAAPATSGGKGGGNYHFTNCITEGHNYGNDCGITVTNVPFFTATGTLASTTTSIPCTIATRGWIGGYLIVGTDPMLHRITAVSGSAVTIESPGLTSQQVSQTAYYVPGEIRFTGLKVLDNTRGIQALTSGALITRMMTFVDTQWDGNTVDWQDVGKGLTATGTITSVGRGVDVTTHLSVTNTAGVQTNFLPVDITVYMATNTAAAVGDRWSNPTALTALPAGITSLTVPPGGHYNIACAAGVKALIA